MTDLLRLFGPITLWLASFSAIYGLNGLVCSWRWADFGLTEPQGRYALIAAWLLAVALQAAVVFVLRAPRFASPSPLVATSSFWLSVVAVVSMVWTLFPVAVTSTCG